MTGDGVSLLRVTFGGDGLVVLALPGSNHLSRSRGGTGNFVGFAVEAGIWGILVDTGGAAIQSVIGGGAGLDVEAIAGMVGMGSV